MPASPLLHCPARRRADDRRPGVEETERFLGVARGQLGRMGEDVELVGDRQLCDGSQLGACEWGAAARDAMDVQRLDGDEGWLARRAIAGALALDERFTPLS